MKAATRYRCQFCGSVFRQHRCHAKPPLRLTIDGVTFEPQILELWTRLR